MKCTGPEFQELTGELLAAGGVVRFQANGGSMYPFIRGREVVRVKPAPPRGIRYGDIVLYKSPGDSAILHRVLKIRKSGENIQFYIRGDSLGEADGYINGDSVVGKVVVVEKGRIVLDIEKGFWRYVNIVYTFCLPFSRWLLSLVAGALSPFVKKHPSIKAREILTDLLKGENISAADLCGSDWERVLNKSREECVFYPAYRKLLESGLVKSIPGPVRQKFEASYHLYLAHSAARAHAADQALGSLDSIGKKMLLVKGPAIDIMVYDGFFRPRVDLDLVVGKSISDAGRELAGLGYLSREGEGSRRVTDRLKSRIFINKDAELMPLHIHSNLINNNFLTCDGLVNIGMEDIGSQTEAYKDYRNIVALKPEMNMLYLCDHGLKHDFGRLIYSYEIDKLISYYGRRLDWDKFIILARNLGMERSAYYGLYFSKEIFGGSIPDEVISSVKPKALSTGEKIFIKNTLNDKHRKYSSFFVYLAARRGFARKLNFIFRLILG